MLVFQIIVGCNRDKFGCSRQHRVVVEYNKDPVSDHWELIYGRCVPGDVSQTGMQCGPQTFHQGTIYMAADTPAWTRVTLPLPEKVFSRSAFSSILCRTGCFKKHSLLFSFMSSKKVAKFTIYRHTCMSLFGNTGVACRGSLIVRRPQSSHCSIYCDF